MKQISIGNGAMNASELALGCMRDCRIPFEEAESLVLTAAEDPVPGYHEETYSGVGRRKP